MCLGTVHTKTEEARLTVRSHEVVRHRHTSPLATSLTAAVDSDDLVLIHEQADQISPVVRVAAASMNEDDRRLPLLCLAVDVVPELGEVEALDK
jgi:hypothetical protein